MGRIASVSRIIHASVSGFAWSAGKAAASSADTDSGAIRGVFGITTVSGVIDALLPRFGTRLPGEAATAGELGGARDERR